MFGGTGIRARVKRITTAYANHYTIPPDLDRHWSVLPLVHVGQPEKKKDQKNRRFYRDLNPDYKDQNLGC